MVKIAKKGNKAWVTFTTPVLECEKVEIKGSWNDWQPEEMKKKKNGEFYIRKYLPANQTYEFGYLIDGNKWIWDDTVETVYSPFGSKNSVLKI
ncbi:isoamylase early set domain-containing protein [Hydrogenothermus marinus]|uniref:AMP-activated protein kinase-like protein n=1 Tax=Hydrogenothermus marinus TaxID=133270 RepID=A0A3M0C417_9AQUI|nr:isoamylase early set domain-containing protein [Hydrogenothermus marinus]RMA97702.1 AMP-activated protein kinase-like protein [Hydrogenothermus marinus]